jgi:hypothetical protein
VKKKTLIAVGIIVVVLVIIVLTNSDAAKDGLNEGLGN